MPKKKNFLGGMQNYNPNTGEYEPSLKGPNGESPSGFKKFQKGDEEKNSFNEYNNKRLGKTKEETTSFKVDKEKYPDVKETPYGFIYNVNGESITDLKEQKRKFGEPVDESKNYGFTVTKNGDETFYESFDDAYRSIKGKDLTKTKDEKMAEKIDKEMKPVFDEARKKDAEVDNRLDKFAEKFGIEFKDIRDEFVNRYQKAIKEQGFGGKDAIDVAMDSLEDDLVMGWKPTSEENSFDKYNQKRIGKTENVKKKLNESQHNKKMASETSPGKMIKYHPLMRDVENKTYNFGEQQRAKMLNNGLAMGTKKRSGLGYIKDQNGRYIPQQYYVLIDVETGMTCGRVSDYENGLEKTNDAEFIERVNRARDAFKQKNAQLFNGE